MTFVREQKCGNYHIANTINGWDWAFLSIMPPAMQPVHLYFWCRRELSLMWSEPAPSAPLALDFDWLIIQYRQPTAWQTRKMSQSSNQADFSRGKEQGGEKNWQEGELWGGNIKEGNNISVRAGGIKEGNIRPFTACNLKTLDILSCPVAIIISCKSFKFKDGMNFVKSGFQFWPDH